MRKIITLLTFLITLSAFAQNEVVKKVNELIGQNADFKHYAVLTPADGIRNSTIDQVVYDATFAKINLQSVSDLVAQKHNTIEVEIPYKGQTILVQLYKVDIFAEDFHLDTDRARNISYNPGVYYRGIVKGNPNSLVSFNFFNNELNGIISNDEVNNLVIGKLVKDNNVSDYIIYSDANMKVQNETDCATKDILTEKAKSILPSTELTSTRCVTMYFEVDNNLYITNQSNTTTTTNWVTSVFNNVQTLYNNDGITVALKSMFIWTTADPYSGSGSSDYLYGFAVNRPVFDGDVGQLIGIDPGGLGGVAQSINGLCSTENHSYSDVDFAYLTVPVYSWTVMVITHEFGHLLGSPHTHACIWNGNNTAIDNCGPFAIGPSGEGYSCMTTPATLPTFQKGTLMSYCHLVGSVGIKFQNGFGTQPKAKILAAVNGGACLSTDCINTCINNIIGVNAINITATAATINWTQSGTATPSELSVYPLSENSGSWTTPATNSYEMSGLLPNTYYKAVVRNACGAGLIGTETAVVFATNGDYCSGILLTDSGGPNGNYSDMETIVRTIIPNNPNAKAKITFSSFDLELDYDYLYVYNGPDTTYPDLSSGGFTGTTIPGPLESTAADGSLTLKFVSDPYVVGAGYQATISCLTLGTDKFNAAIDFTYSPNPTNGVVSIVSKTTFDEVAVYNLEGRLLYQNKVNGLNTTVDMTDFATGTYFFKLKFNGKEVNFKILKM